MQIDKKETVKQVYRFLKSYPSLVKLSLDDVRREIFTNLFTRRTGERLKLWQLYETLEIDRAEYERLKAEILLDFAKSYRGGVLLVYE